MIISEVLSLAGRLLGIFALKSAGEACGAGSSSLAIPGCTCEAEAGRATSAREEAVPTWLGSGFGFGFGFGLGSG